MLVNNLEIGKEYKYKDMCKLLQIDEKSRGKSRTLQLKNWARYFKFYKPNPSGQIFIVYEIYDVPKEKIDNRGKSEGSRNNYKGIYAEYIDVLLLQYLQKLADNLGACKVDTTNNKIAEAIGIVNHNYRTAFSNQGKFYNTVYGEFNIENNKYCMRDVFDWIKMKVREIVKASLNRLQKSEKLEYEYCYFIYSQYSIRKPTEYELVVIHLADEKVMKEMGVSDKKQIEISYKLTKEFNGKVLKEVNEEFDYIENIFKGYSIVLREDVELKSDEDIKELMVKFNFLVINFLKEKPEKVQKETIKKEGLEKWFGARNTSWNSWVFDRLSKRYIEYCCSFINILCAMDAPNIVNKISSYKNTTEKQKYKYRDEACSIEENLPY